jgi:hypothetical protein
MKIPRRQFLHLAAGAVSLPAVSQNRALFGAAATKGERAFCGAATGGVDSPLWVKSGALLPCPLSASTSCGHGPSSESDVMGQLRPPALQKEDRG